MNISCRLRVPLWAALVICAPVLARAQSYPPAWSSASSYAIGDQVQLSGNVLRCTHAVAPGGFKYGDWELWDVRANTNVMIGVGQTFTTLTAAWSYVQNARVADGAYLHLFIDTVKGNFSQSLANAFSLDHASGAKISILGDKASNTTLTFTGAGSDGFTIDSGHDFAAVSNLQMTGPAVAIHATSNAVINSITGLAISGWNTGLRADSGAMLFPDQTDTFSGIVQSLLMATTYGTIQYPLGNSVTSTTAAEVAFYATAHGYISAELSKISNTSQEAILATDGGDVDASYSTFTNCNSGVNADEGSFVVVEQITITGDTTTDLTANHSSTIDAAATTGVITSATNNSQIFL